MDSPWAHRVGVLLGVSWALAGGTLWVTASRWFVVWLAHRVRRRRPEDEGLVRVWLGSEHMWAERVDEVRVRLRNQPAMTDAHAPSST